MNHQQILTEAIEKAIEGGWTPPFEEPITNVSISQDDVEGTPQLEPYIKIEFDNDSSDYLVGIPGLLFSHDFAKALWGKEPLPYTIAWYKLNDNKELQDYVAENRYVQAWERHLIAMVIADDPIAYLGDNLPA